jgi:hypothetical protein
MRRILKWTLALVAGLVLTQFLTPGIGYSADWVKWKVSHGYSSQPNCESKGYFRDHKPDDADSSDVYKPPTGESYFWQNTWDGKRNTAWAGVAREVAVDGQPDSWIEWRFEESTHVEVICLRNGYHKDAPTYMDNKRVHNAVVICGDYEKSIALANHTPPTTPGVPDPGPSSGREWQEFEQIDVDCDSPVVRLHIMDYHAADDESDDVVAISEARFFSK